MPTAGMPADQGLRCPQQPDAEPALMQTRLYAELSPTQSCFPCRAVFHAGRRLRRSGSSQSGRAAPSWDGCQMLQLGATGLAWKPITAEIRVPGLSCCRRQRGSDHPSHGSPRRLRCDPLVPGCRRPLPGLRRWRLRQLSQAPAAAVPLPGRHGLSPGCRRRGRGQQRQRPVRFALSLPDTEAAPSRQRPPCPARGLPSGGHHGRPARS